MFTTKNFFSLLGKHLVITAGVVVLSCGIVYFFAEKITQISEESMKGRQLATSLSERASRLSSLKHESELIGNNDKIIKQAFIPSDNILPFIAVIKNLAFKNGITQAFNFSTPTPTDLGGSFPVAMITYQNTLSSVNVSALINYLKEFDQLPYFTRIDSLNFSSGGDWRTGGTVSLSASVVAQIVK